MRRRFVSLMLAVLLVFTIFPSVSVFVEEKTEFVLKVELTENYRVLTWDKYPDASSYYAYTGLTYWDNGEKVVFVPMSDFPVTKTSIEDFSKTPGIKKFIYKVCALDAEGEVLAESNIVTLRIGDPTARTNTHLRLEKIVISKMVKKSFYSRESNHRKQ
ncbi:MAG: hypothetical protein R2883_00345 [Caldisericia bacterium]